MLKTTEFFVTKPKIAIKQKISIQMELLRNQKTHVQFDNLRTFIRLKKNYKNEELAASRMAIHIEHFMIKPFGRYSKCYCSSKIFVIDFLNFVYLPAVFYFFCSIDSFRTFRFFSFIPVNAEIKWYLEFYNKYFILIHTLHFHHRNL